MRSFVLDEFEPVDSGLINSAVLWEHQPCPLRWLEAPLVRATVSILCKVPRNNFDGSPKMDGLKRAVVYSLKAEEEEEGLTTILITPRCIRTQAYRFVGHRSI